MSEARDPERLRWLQRLLEMLPGLLSWAILVVPIWLSVSYPWLIGYFIVAFDVYWLARVVRLAVGAVAGRLRVRRVLETNWSARLAMLHDRPAHREEMLRHLAGLPQRPGAALGFDALADGRRERARLERELDALDLVDELETPPPSPGEFVHLALIATGGEPLHALRLTVRALAEADWPAERKICAIITRRNDEGAKANVDVLRAEFGPAFADMLHVLDPLDPGIVVDAGRALSFGSRAAYRVLVRERGMDPRRVLVTGIDGDYRVDRQYFSHLTWTHLATEDRETQLYQPIPFLDNDLWAAPLPLRLFAAVLTQLQLARSLTVRRFQAVGCVAATLALIHDVGYWASEAVLDDGRLAWKGYFAHGDRFGTVPLFMPVHGDAGRARVDRRALVGQFLQPRRWAWGVGDLAYVLEGLLRRAAIPVGSRVRRIGGLIGEHAGWAVTPMIVLFGTGIPILLGVTLTGSAPSAILTLTALATLALALVVLLLLVWVELGIMPARPRSWGILRRGLTDLLWMGLPFVGIFLSVVPALDAGTRPRSGRAPEASQTR